MKKLKFVYLFLLVGIISLNLSCSKDSINDDVNTEINALNSENDNDLEGATDLVDDIDERPNPLNLTSEELDEEYRILDSLRIKSWKEGLTD